MICQGMNELAMIMRPIKISGGANALPLFYLELS
jgi:hypothetical protein